MQVKHGLHLGFIGTGKVGTTLARLWYQAGYTIAALHNRTRETASKLAGQINSVMMDNALEVVKASDLVLLAVPDDVIEPLAQTLVGTDWRKKAVVHTSGAKSVDVLSVLGERGAMVGSLHPAFPFANVETAVQNLPGTSFAIEAADKNLRHDLEQLVFALDGQAMIVPNGKKAAYHAAMVITSNYTVVLYAAAQSLLISMGMPKIAVENALNGILAATVANLQNQGIPMALTGPLVRDDVGTIESHLTALNDNLLRQTYRDLARLAYPILEARNLPTHHIDEILRQEE